MEWSLKTDRSTIVCRQRTKKEMHLFSVIYDLSPLLFVIPQLFHLLYEPPSLC